LQRLGLECKSSERAKAPSLSAPKRINVIIIARARTIESINRFPPKTKATNARERGRPHPRRGCSVHLLYQEVHYANASPAHARSVSRARARAAGPLREADFSRCSFLPDVTISRAIITSEREGRWTNARRREERRYNSMASGWSQLTSCGIIRRDGTGRAH